MKICYKCEDLTDSPESTNVNYPMCESCFNGWACFTCEFCEGGLASEQIDFSNGMREWWCISCKEEHFEEAERLHVSS
jgi:hypothetical protein